MPKSTAAEKAPPSLKVLRVKLKEIQISFSDIWMFVDGYREDSTQGQIEVRLGKIDELWENFCDTLIQIKAHDDFKETDDLFDKERQDLSNQYYFCKAFLVDRAREFAVPDSINHTVRMNESSGHSGMDHVRLPQIKLQSFNGDIEDWLGFRDLFTSLIHWKTDLSEVEKFHYLKGCLEGEPKTLIDSLQITQANYTVAWETLLKRYNNSKQLKKRQIQALFSLPHLNKESTVDLHALLEGFEKNVQILDQVVQPENYKELLLVHLLSTRLDPVTRRGWEELSASKEADTLGDLTEFIRRRIAVLEALPSKALELKGGYQQTAGQKQKPYVRVSHNASQQQQQQYQQQQYPQQQYQQQQNQQQQKPGACIVCKREQHGVHQCPKFKRSTVSERVNLLRTHGLCRNCLRTGHQARNCPSKFSCKQCSGRHHSLVCFRSENNSNGQVSVNASRNDSFSDDQEAESSTRVANMAAPIGSSVNSASQFRSRVLLATAVVIIEDDMGNQLPARALLDSGSESNFMTQRLSQRIKVSRNKVDVSILGIGQVATKVKQKVSAVVKSRTSEYARELSFLVLHKVTATLPTANVNTGGWNIPEGISLADPAFFQSNSVDLVLGIECFFEFFETGRRISLGANLPALNESVFGWIVCGGVSQPDSSLRVSCNVSANETLDMLVSRFWESEEIGSKRNYSPEESLCEEIFEQTVQRSSSGRYSVALPTKKIAVSRLGGSRDIAYRRLLGTERRFARDTELKRQYMEFMEEYHQLGHMRKVPAEDIGNFRRCFLPHHPVIKEASTTTKVRVVFDASCKTSSGVSLNDVLMTGPVVQDDLRSIIMRCRTKAIMLVADVEKMFRQIEIQPEDRPLQCVLWRKDPSEDVGVYELNTVTYGTKPAPFLATRTLQQLTSDEASRFPLAAQAMADDTYMDDVITGVNILEEAIELRKQLEQITESGGFRLRKFACNRSEVLQGIPQDNLAIPGFVDLDPDPSVKTLGLTWLPGSDTFMFQFNLPKFEDLKLTKRNVLSVIAMLFDPLGLIGATITMAKIYMQQLWTLQNSDGKRLDWDEQLPSTVGERWRKFHEELSWLNTIRIDRCVILPSSIELELHCFSDASEKAFGGCIYLRSRDSHGLVWTRLVSSKSKVAPLKCQSIARLELSGALLIAEQFEKVKDSLRIPTKAFFWTDSTCVLRWLQAIPTVWTTYVANRVSKIQTITQGCKWSHVPGIENPADLISRGVSPSNIVENQFWWRGPAWLQESPESWPQAPAFCVQGEGEEELRRTTVVAVASEVEEFVTSYISNSSSFIDLIRKTAYFLRLKTFLRNKLRNSSAEPNRSFLSVLELKLAEFDLISKIQKVAFADEWKALAEEKPVSRSSPMRWYNPFLTSEGVIRLGGRLRNSDEPHEAKYPIALPARHLFSTLLIRYHHEKLLHAGPQLLLSVLRQRYWIFGGRETVRNVIHRCLKCFRAKPSPVQQFMGDLPASRVTIAPAFRRSGVDYFGPVYVRPAPRRPAVKAYVCVFVCLCTKAVHLELVSDLTTDRFIQALRRFVGRRGKCAEILSDNGTNFVGARNKMKDLIKLLNDPLHREQVAKECVNTGIQWKFSPPSAPHFGGLWEAAVRSAKTHLLKVLGEEPVSPEDFNTLLIQVEACLNSRPLTPCSDDPNDLEPLTPAHFITGSSLQEVPDEDLSDVPFNRLGKCQQVQKRFQQFWKRWRREYLCQLQGRTKRWKSPVGIHEGTLVVLKDENLPPLRWKMARIQQTYPGSDGVVRVVKLKTAQGYIDRPVEKICILPIEPMNP
ncbi:uncharacterized protein LOC129760346 [Uranotaenia lowii]|uniref:uncharacterized protein LOC129760346 n=1 Tax=Uranotaenia lowii TaxID=190385 RepID=UPI0024786E72|nr:uncharacterized protein LOC129760346 [Uranotaenia lowii]